jgi:hypothetical protein
VTINSQLNDQNSIRYYILMYIDQGFGGAVVRASVFHL